MNACFPVKTGSGGAAVWFAPPRPAGGVGASALPKNVGWAVMMTLAPAFTACWSTAIVAIEVVTIPLTMVDGSPAFTLSTESSFHSTPMFFLMRSITSSAVIAAAPDNVLAHANGAAAASAANSRLERSAIGSTNHSRVSKLFQHDQ